LRALTGGGDRQIAGAASDVQYARSWLYPQLIDEFFGAVG
jgi:hypothetical protein